jgi:hypothetical protein
MDHNIDIVHKAGEAFRIFEVGGLVANSIGCDDFVPGQFQKWNQFGADETRRASDQDFHSCNASRTGDQAVDDIRGRNPPVRRFPFEIVFELGTIQP